MPDTKNQMSNIIEINDLSKIYGEGVTTVNALRSVNLRISGNSFIAVIGPSGSGKTTLLGCLGGILKPSEGKIKVDGLDLASLSANALATYRQEKVGFVFQSFNLVPSLTAIENIEVALKIAGKRNGESTNRARRLLKQMNLEKRAHHHPAELSGGEKQRVSIARALANDPQVMLADEPTANLDTQTARRVIRLLEDLAKNHNKTVIVVTHDERMIDHVDKVYRLTDGEIDYNYLPSLPVRQAGLDERD